MVVFDLNFDTRSGRIYWKGPLRESRSHDLLATDGFTLPALTIARLYKCRWNVELFFKWIKQHLRIKTFFGTSENAVKTQIWIAVCVYVLIAIIKKELHLSLSLTEIQQILSLVLFEKVLIEQALTNTPIQERNVGYRNQLLLFDL